MDIHPGNFKQKKQPVQRLEVRAKLAYSGKNKETRVAEVSKQVGKGQEERSYLDLLGLCSHWKDFGFYAE